MPPSLSPPGTRGGGGGGISARSAPHMLFEDPPKKVYLIRHGESIGQTKLPRIRTTDKSLLDCDLTEKGEFQADVLPSVLGLERYRRIDCVFSSPLTRALRTSLSGFPTKSITIVYDLMEIGNNRAPIPENIARPIKEVIKDTGGKSGIDIHTFAPAHKQFPQSHENLPASVRRNKLKKVWSSIWDYCDGRKYNEIAVVCHSTIILASLQDRELKPENGIPIECLLYPNGRLQVDEIISNQVQEFSNTLADLKRQNNWLMNRRVKDETGENSPGTDDAETSHSSTQGEEQESELTEEDVVYD